MPIPLTVHVLTQDEANKVLVKVQNALPATPFLVAAPSPVAGLVKLTLANGKTMYADASGRYVMMGIIFDLDTGDALDDALTAVGERKHLENNP